MLDLVVENQNNDDLHFFRVDLFQAFNVVFSSVVSQRNILRLSEFDSKTILCLSHGSSQAVTGLLVSLRIDNRPLSIV